MKKQIITIIQEKYNDYKKIKQKVIINLEYYCFLYTHNNLYTMEHILYKQYKHL